MQGKLLSASLLLKTARNGGTRSLLRQYVASAEKNVKIVQEKIQSSTEDLPIKVVPPVSKANVGSFLQEPPVLGNVFLNDYLLVAYLKRVLPEEVFSAIQIDLERFGAEVGYKIEQLSRECELNPPSLQHYDAWGKRVDKIKTSEAWRAMHDLSAGEGLVAIPYEKKYNEWSRLYQGVKLFMFNASSGLYSCPLAMTDGAAKLIKDLPSQSPFLSSALNCLTSRDSSQFWTSGQWMTEKRGGSDVANGTETIAVPTGHDTYKLYGYKWFTSATDSEMAFTLARIVDRNGQVIEGSRGISLFYVETRKNNGDLNNIEVQRLKNKLGTRQLPTAELLLDGAHALLVSEPGRGVAAISPMLTITRIHNSISAASVMRRILQYCRDYATKRRTFKKTLVEYPLHMQTLAKMETECSGAFLFNMEVFRLLGLSECGKANETEEHLIRFLTPILKLYTAKQANSVLSEGLESIGGQGYIEDTGLPTLYRDAQVLSIWEGTTNVLSLDVLRSIAKSKGKVLEAFVSDIQSKMSKPAKDESLINSRDKLMAALARLGKFMDLMATKPEQYVQNAARDFAFSCARVYMGALMFEHAASDYGSARDTYVLKRWCMKNLTPVIGPMEAGVYDASWKDIDHTIVMTGHFP